VTTETLGIVLDLQPRSPTRRVSAVLPIDCFFVHLVNGFFQRSFFEFLDGGDAATPNHAHSGQDSCSSVHTTIRKRV
jgi:hypothetical protein